MSNIEMGVKLPSRGKPYRDYPELSGTIVLRMISAKQEKRIYGSSGNPYRLAELLKDCIVSPEFPIDILTIEDKYFLLAKLRVHSYGDIVHSFGNCSCDYKGEFDVSINDVPVRELEEDYLDVVKVELPASGDTVEARILVSGDYDEVKKRVESLVSKVGSLDRGSQSYITQIAMSIKTVNGEPMMIGQAEDYVSGLYSKDLLVLRKVQNKYQYGFSDFGIAKCPRCGKDVIVPVTLNYEFFHPRLG